MKNKFFRPNMGIADRIIRILAAILIIILYFTHQIYGSTAGVLLAVAGIFLITGFVRFCPLYYPFHINTSKKKDTHASPE